MAVLSVVHYPGPPLKQICEPVRAHDKALKILIENMFETMASHPRCVGLAAPQVGQALRLFTMDASRVEKPGSLHGRLVLINPRLVGAAGRRLVREGCLSIPDYTGNVTRAESVHVTGWDEKGDPLEIKAHGFEAIVLQHELDHLDGRLFLDRVGSLSTDVFRRKNYG